MPADNYTVVQGSLAAELKVKQMLEVSFNLTADCHHPVTEEQAKNLIDRFLAAKRQELPDQERELNIWWRFSEVEWLRDDWAIFRYTLEPDPPPLLPVVHIHITDR